MSDRKIVDYLILDKESLGELESRVKKWMADGWQPLGAPMVQHINWHQAMVKYEEVDNRPSLEELKDDMLKGYANTNDSSHMTEKYTVATNATKAPPYTVGTVLLSTSEKSTRDLPLVNCKCGYQIQPKHVQYGVCKNCGSIHSGDI